MQVIGWIDHPDAYGPLTPSNVDLLEEPRYLLSAIIVSRWEEGLEAAFKGWARFGRQEAVEAMYAYVEQLRRGLLDEGRFRAALLKVLWISGAEDVAAIQRILKLATGRTTCDFGVVAFFEAKLPLSPWGRPPPTAMRSLEGPDYLVYLARNAEGPPVYDLETMCVVPYTSAPTGRHPLQEAYEAGLRIATEGPRAPDDLCVAHRRIQVACRRLGQFPPPP